VRRLLAIVFLLVACRPEPVVKNPYKAKARGGGPPEVAKKQEVAADGTVKARDGTAVALGSLWQDNRVVIVFYRGQWCPHCQHQLGELNGARAEIEKGARLIAISSDSVEAAAAMHKKLDLGYEVYSDPELAVITKWGVADYAKGISLPATFVVEKGGAISYRKIGKNPTDHPTLAELRAALAQ
jgi:peroxiredoxin